MIWLSIVLLLLPLAASRGGTDLTLLRDSMGPDVVRGVLSKLDDINIFDATSSQAERQIYEQFMRESAYVESQDGMAYPLDNPNGGIWRLDQEIFEQTQRYTYPQIADICEIYCVDWPHLPYSDLQIPLYSGIATRLYLFHLNYTGQRLNETSLDEDRAAFYANNFANRENNAESRWIENVNRLRNIEVCRVDTDVVFVVDSSGSIGRSNYQTVRDYTYNFTQGLLAGDTNTRVGLILYSTSARVEIDLDSLSTEEVSEESVLGRISNLTYQRGWTNTPEGLCLLKTMPWRESVSILRIAIVLTDGKSNRFSATCMNEQGSVGTVNSTAEEVHSLVPPVTVLAVGVANFVQSELDIIATSPDLVDTLSSFDYRLLLQNQFSRTYFICFKESQTVNMNENQIGEVGMGSVSRLEFSGPADEGVTVRICIDNGVVHVYGSYTITNPSAALHDFSEVLAAAEGEVMATNCLVTSATLDDVSPDEECSICSDTPNGVNRRRRRRRRQVDNGGGEEVVTIYLTIEGASDSQNQFSINSTTGLAFECAEDFCGENAVLIRADGSCSCQCVEGYEGNGQECTNQNECEVMPDLCAENEVCTDTEGSYTCICPEGHESDGNRCNKIPGPAEEELFQAEYYVIVIGALCAAAMLIVTIVLSVYLVVNGSRKRRSKH